MGVLDLMLPWITRAAVLVSVVLLTLTTLHRHSDIPLSQATLRVAHLCSFSVWFGTSVWVSFIAGIVLMRAVTIETFGLAQAKLFDAYFKFSLLCLAVAGFTGAALSSSSSARSDGEDGSAVGTTPFLVAVACVVANLVFFSPQTTITMMERSRVCKELGVDRTSPDPRVRKLSKRFGMFHGITNLINLVALACGAIHLCALAERLSL
ncbi:unnamed protein product [Ectocarpus sp. CCAP 1310/34]|nr:unnamed protein product [Ectocarpus sp. CCAP 1310/34]